MTNWVLPTNIPWDILKGSELEECVYWLLDAMGAKDLQWRRGSAGAGASDGGRDLEAMMHVPTPDGEVQTQRWWVECKGRTGTVEKEAVVGAIQNAGAESGLSLLIVASNSYFTVPTQDWVKGWNEARKQPLARLWDRSTIERLICRHPEVAARMFKNALSPEGRLQVVRNRFWNEAQYPDQSIRREIWDSIPPASLESDQLVALISGEAANGNLSDCPWLARCETEVVEDVFATGMVNFFYFIVRADRAGSAVAPYASAMSYCLLACLDRVGADRTKELLEIVAEDAKIPADAFMEQIVGDVLNEPWDNLRDVCTATCKRVSTDPISLREDQLDTFWHRLQPPPTDRTKKAEKSVLVMEHHLKPCDLGLSLNTEISCPYTRHDDDSPLSLIDMLKQMELTIKVKKSGKS